ncbi:protein of unknown function [Methylocaldum szegediense]|uniref:Uncharacterized protein n=1 Tax=Methylocaldum szegediense TaxID=73780 RepID=A0ABM9I2P2_9GAMM|nr:protein of unknown function [Methylocaldum szegediense]
MSARVREGVEPPVSGECVAIEAVPGGEVLPLEGVDARMYRVATTQGAGEHRTAKLEFRRERPVVTGTPPCGRILDDRIADRLQHGRVREPHADADEGAARLDVDVEHGNIHVAVALVWDAVAGVRLERPLVVAEAGVAMNSGQ